VKVGTALMRKNHGQHLEPEDVFQVYIATVPGELSYELLESEYILRKGGLTENSPLALEHVAARAARLNRFWESGRFNKKVDPST